MGKNVGVDLGYGYVKTTDGEKEHVFPSVVGMGHDIKYRSDLSSHNRLLENLMVSVDGKKYFVGDLAIRQSEIAARSLDQNRVEDRNVKVLLLTALGLYTEHENQSINMVTGLPTNYYASYKEAWIGTLRGSHRVVFHLGGAEREKALSIDRLRIVPQPFGTLYDRVLDDKGGILDEDMARLKVGIIDIGFKTSDFAFADGLEFIERMSSSSATALSSAYAIIAGRLREEMGIDKENYELDKIVERGEIRIAGRSHDISRIKREAFERVATKIITEVDSLWDYRDLDLILITGGGGQALSEHLLAEFRNAALVDNPQLANVRGYLKLANNIFRAVEAA